MFIFSWIAIFTATLANAEPARILQIAPVKDFFQFNQESGGDSSCMVSLPKPVPVKVLSETPTEFEVEWKVEISGCYWQQLKGQSMKRGFIKKRDIIWDENLKEELPMISFAQRMPEKTLTPVECLNPVEQKFVPDAVKAMDLDNFIDFLRRETAGMKPKSKVDQYLRCYPYRNNPANYQKYKKFLDMTGDVFKITSRREPQEVNPSLLSCLYRRESGFEIPTGEGAAGLGQHTNINIKEISNRLKKPGSWEAVLWKQYFEKVRSTPEGRAMLASCMGSSKSGEPIFDTKQDAACPLQSMAAGSIYILMIQRELARNSKIIDIKWENELEYQVAIAAAYNLGDGAAGSAVKDLLINDWVGAIRRKSTQAAPGKDCEVLLHINAVRNCLQANNPWQPMHPDDTPQCGELRGVKINLLDKKNSCVVPPPAVKPKK